MGFCAVWIKWIIKCITSVSFSTLINDEVKGFFKGGEASDKGIPCPLFSSQLLCKF